MKLECIGSDCEKRLPVVIRTTVETLLNSSNLLLPDVIAFLVKAILLKCLIFLSIWLGIDDKPANKRFDKTAQALRAGRPTLIMPYSHDQPDNAARVERLGTSRTIPRKQYSASRIVKQLRELLENSSYKTKASEIGRIIQAENGVGVACNAIEKQLGAVAASS